MSITQLACPQSLVVFRPIGHPNDYKRELWQQLPERCLQLDRAWEENIVLKMDVLV